MAFRQREDSEFEREKEMFDNGMSREALIRSELSGSVSILPEQDIPLKKDNEKTRPCKPYLIIAIVALVFLIIGITLLIVGLVLLSTAPKCEKLSEEARYQSMCQPSNEAQDNGFYKLLDKAHTLFFTVFPNKIAYKRPVSVAEIRREFRIYDPSPAVKKNVTDKVMNLLKEANELKLNKLKLTQRESKALSQLKHSLKYMFGYTYSTNYYAGDYLLGPNLWCVWDPICHVGSDLSNTLRYFKPNTVEDMELLRDRLKGVQRAFGIYIDNLKYGVKAGMVRTIGECKASIYALTKQYRNIAYEAEQGVFKEDFIEVVLNATFLSNLTGNVEEANKWYLKYEKTVNASLREFIVEYVGKPIASLFRYLRTEHIHRCVPTSVSSGLSSLPLSFVYINGTADTSQRTTKRLPTGEKLDGKTTYKMLVGAFTTSDISPDGIYDLGIKMLNKLYPEALQLAKKVTGYSDNDTAVRLFLQKLNSSEMYYNKDKMPANESDEKAYRACSTVEDARKNCPKRWKAMEEWFADITSFNNLIYPKIVKMFHFAGEKYSVPNCPIEVTPELNPSVGANYQPAGYKCLKSARYKIPFFESRFGPKWTVLSVSAHEGRPGHHTQIQGMLERFRDGCGGVIAWLNSLTFYSAYIEGWALYAESPLVGKETDIYNNRPLDKYGLLKWQIWRALRLVVDAGMHSKGMSRKKALEYFAKYTWDEGETAEKEVTRYQSAFGQATSYMIGQQQIVKLRAYAQKELGAKFSLKDFHFYLLSQGSYPLNYVAEIVEKYVSCIKNKEQIGCDIVLNPPRMTKGSSLDQGVKGDTNYQYDHPQLIHDEERYY